jgi:hypothetical protein
VKDVGSAQLTKLDIALISLVAICFAIVYGINWYAALSCPYCIEYEGTMLWAANALSHGQNIYDAARLVTPPWAVITYPPLFLCIGAVFVKCFGLAFWYLRLISLVSAVVSVALIYVILRRSGCPILVAVIGPAYFMGFTPVFLWTSLGRPDTLALALCLLGMERTYAAFQQSGTQKSGFSQALIGGLSFALACFAKQTSVVCLVTAILFLIWCKKYRIAGIVAATSAALILLLFGSAQVLTGGLIEHLRVFSTTPWSADTLTRYLHFMTDADVTRAEICLGIPLYCTVFRKQTTSVPERLPYALFGLSLAQMLYIMGLPGSNGNHAIFSLLALSWWLALKCGILSTRVARIVLVASLSSLISLTNYVPAIIAAMPKDVQPLMKVDLKNKLVLSEDPYNNFLSESTPAMIDCAVFTSIWKDRPDKIGQIVDRIDQREYAAIVINCQDSEGKEKYFWPDVVLSAIRANYQKSGKLNGNGICQMLWLPK